MKDNSSNIQIDAIIPWVNGNDKNWQKKLNEYSDIKIDFNKKKESVRFNSIGEIDIAIKSIIKYAPFFKNIFLVTDNQIPDTFETLKALGKSSGINLEIVDHKVLFQGYEDFLPCFNSCSIETLLFRTPNLSEHFVIFNDDFFLMRETKPNDFFINGQPVIRGNWSAFNENRKNRNLFKKLLSLIKRTPAKKNTSFKELQQNGAKLAGTDKYIRRFHSPYPIRKTTLVNFFKNYDLSNNIKHKFRNKEQFLIYSLSDHLEIKNNSYIYKKDTKLTYFRSYKNYHLTRLKLYLFDKNKNKAFMTFQSLEMADKKSQKFILEWINKRIN